MSVFGLSTLSALAIIGQASVLLGLCQLLLFFVSLFLILLVLVQRGKGGGLTGALGGMGGQSAFGAKAGDAFTKITIITTIVWITICMVTISGFNPPPAAKVSKKMTLMEKARLLDQSPSIGAPSKDATIPDDMMEESMSGGMSGDADDDSKMADGDTDTEDNVAQKQTPENTPSTQADADEAAPELESGTETESGTNDDDDEN